MDWEGDGSLDSRQALEQGRCGVACRAEELGFSGRQNPLTVSVEESDLVRQVLSVERGYAAAGE